ncbi:MAG: hypothetical protein ACJ790_18900, partial [Myxococcaceae bacterium]
KVRPHGAPKGARTAMTLRAARGETESFYVVLEAPAGMRVRASCSVFTSDRSELPSKIATFSRAYFVDAGNERLADAVVALGDRSAVAKADESLPLVVDVAVPRSALPGSYLAVVTVTGDGRELAKVPVTLNVMPVEIPATASLPTAFTFGARDVWMVHNGPKSRLPSIAQRYALSGLKHRVSLVGGSGVVPAQEGTTPGEGWMELDFSRFDSEVQPFMNGVSELDGAQATSLGLSSPSGLSQMERFKYVLAVRKHLREHGWSNRMVLVDGVPLFAKIAPHGKATLCQCDGITSCRATHEGDRPWWKLSGNAAPGEPSIALGTDPIKIREIGWYAFDLDVAGIAFDDAVGGFDDAALGGKPKTTALYYPPGYAGSEGWPVESVRLKLLRDGLEDYELLRQADSIRKERLKARVGELLPKPRDTEEELRGLLDDPELRTEVAPSPGVSGPR